MEGFGKRIRSGHKAIKQRMRDGNITIFPHSLTKSCCQNSSNFLQVMLSLIKDRHHLPVPDTKAQAAAVSSNKQSFYFFWQAAFNHAMKM